MAQVGLYLFGFGTIAAAWILWGREAVSEVVTRVVGDFQIFLIACLHDERLAGVHGARSEWWEFTKIQTPPPSSAHWEPQGENLPTGSSEQASKQNKN